MSDASFHEQVDELMNAIETALDDLDVDIDAELGAGVLTLTCENGSAIILSRQSAASELWLAAKSGGFHYRFDPSSGEWLSTRDGEPSFRERFNAAVFEQAGTTIDW